MDEDYFVSAVVITVKSEKSVKIGLDSRELSDSCIKKTTFAEHGGAI